MVRVRPLPPSCQCGAHHLDPAIWTEHGTLLDAWGQHGLPPGTCVPRRDLDDAGAKIAHRLEAIGAP